MQIRLHAESAQPVVAGMPASFRVSFRAGKPLRAGARLRLLYDYRGSVGKETLAQTGDPAGANFVDAASARAAPLHLRAYSAAHSYKPGWSDEPECYTWVDLLEPDVSLNCHVVEITFDQGLAAGDTVTVRFGANARGFLLTRKSYNRYPIWAIADAGDGTWRAAGATNLTVGSGDPARAMVTLPSIHVTGEPFQHHVQLFDVNFNPVATPPGPPPALVAGPESVRLDGRVGRVHRLAAPTVQGLPAQSNATLVMDGPVRRRLYWGDLHGHCNVCDGGVRGPAEYYTWARDVMALDFCALTAHDFGIAMGDVAARWEHIQAAAAEFDQPGRFAAILGWEATHIGLPRGQAVGHKNVLFRGGTAPFFNGSTYGTPRATVDYRDYVGLREHLAGLDCLVIPHHPLNPLTPGGLGTNWGDFWPARERVVEIHSLWGTSEGMDSPGRTADAVEGTSVLTALMRGYRLGFIGGSDTHDGRPANPAECWTAGATTGLTAVWAPGLSRGDVYDALWQRHCYATTGARIILDVRVGGLSMGQRRVTGAADPLVKRREIEIFAAGAAAIRKVEIVRNGQVIHAFPCSGDTVSHTWTDRSLLPAVAMTGARGRRFVFYYVRLEQEDGHRAWASPVWLDLKAEA